MEYDPSGEICVTTSGTEAIYAAIMVGGRHGEPSDS